MPALTNPPLKWTSLSRQKVFPFPKEPTNGEEQQSVLSFKVDARQGSLQCLQAKGALNILPGKVCVWGYMPHCTKSTPSPFSLHFPLWFNWCNINHQMYTIHYNYNNVSLCQLLQVSGPNGPSSWSAQLNKTTVQPFYNHQYVVELLEVRRHFYYTLEMIKRSNACFMRSCSPLWWATVAQCRSWCI